MERRPAGLPSSAACRRKTTASHTQGIGLGSSGYAVPCPIKARTERRRAHQTNVPLLPLVQARSSASHYGADEPYTYSSRRYLVPPAVAENHQGGSNFRSSTNDFDCAGRGALTSEGPHRIDHAHGYDSNLYRSEHRHFNCPRSRCLSVELAKSTYRATLAAMPSTR